MRKGIKQDGFPWGVTLVLAFLLLLPAFIGSIPVAAANGSYTMWVGAANTGYGAETSYTLDLVLQDDIMLNPGDTVYLRALCNGTPMAEGFDFSQAEATIQAIPDQVNASTCQRLSGELGVMSFTIGDDFPAGTVSCLNIVLDNVINPPQGVEYEEWCWELSINDDDEYEYRSYSIFLTIPPKTLEVLAWGEGPLNECLEMSVVWDNYYLRLRLLDELGYETYAPYDLYINIHEVWDGVKQEGLAPNFWLGPYEGEFVEYNSENPLFIPKGESGTRIYYKRTDANGYEGHNQDMEWGWNYYDDKEIGIVFEAEGVELAGMAEGKEWYQLRVSPGDASQLVAKISAVGTDEGPKIVNWEGDDYYPSLPGVPDGDLVDDSGVYHVKPEHRYEVSIGLTDYYGNPTVDPEDTIKVDLYSDSFEGDGTLKFYEDCDSTEPIDYIEIERGTIWKTVYLEYTAAQEDEGLVICSCSHLETGTEMEVIVENSEAVGLTVYLLDMYNPIASISGEIWRTGQALVWDKQPTPCIVAVVDENGCPTVWNGPGDMPVTLEASEGFLAVSADLDECYHELNMTIPEGCAGVGLYYVRPQPTDNPEDADLLTATAEEQEELGDDYYDYMDVDIYPEWIRLLYPGWNVVSTPVALERARFDQYISQMDVDEEVGLMGIMNGQDLVEVAYTFDPVGKAWHQIYQVPYGDSMNPNEGKWVVQQGSTPDYYTDPVFLFEPMKAVYVKIKPDYLAATTCYPLSTGTGSYKENLKTGWNLIGPALDISNLPHPLLPVGVRVDSFVEDIYSKCLQVADKIPGYTDIEPWIYTPGDEADLEENEIPYVLAGGGVWIYMGEEAELQGTSYTPVQRQPFLQ